jgi:hypothetical protein
MSTLAFRAPPWCWCPFRSVFPHCLHIIVLQPSPCSADTCPCLVCREGGLSFQSRTQTRVHTTPNHAHILYVSLLFFCVCPQGGLLGPVFCRFSHAHKLAYTLLLPQVLNHAHILWRLYLRFCVPREATTILTSEAYVDQIQQHVARLKGELKV